MKVNRMLPVLIYVLASAFYLYEFALQVAPSVMVNDLMYSLNIDAVGISWLAAAYYYAYAPMQIPAGILFDRFSARYLICIAILLCVAGTFVFSSSTSLTFACTGRFLVGIGSAFSFIGILVLISNWFDDKYYALLIGIAQLLSSLGVIVGQKILARLVDILGWQSSMIQISIVGLLLACGVWFVVQDHPNPEHTDLKPTNIDLQSLIQSFVHICSQTQTWLIAFYAFVIWGPMTFFGSLWSVEYLKVLYQFSVDDAIQYEMLIWVGVAVGCPLFGALSNVLKRRVLPMLICALIGLSSSLIMIYVDGIPAPIMGGLLFLLGISAAGQTVSFGLVRDNQPHHQLGSASGFNNMATVAGGAVLQPIMGSLIKYYWDGTILNDIPVYSIHAFQKALILLPLCYIIAMFLTLFFIRESYCKSLGTS